MNGHFPSAIFLSKRNRNYEQPGEEQMITFDADFENASLGQVTRISEDWYQIGLRPDTAYWTHFRVRGCKGREITFNLAFTPRGRANRWAVRDTGNPEDPDYSCRNPWYSYDGKTWQHFDFAASYISMPNTVSFRQQFTQDEVYVCYTIPYTYTDLKKYLETISDHPNIEVETLGKTRNGHDLPLVTVTSNPDARDLVMFICRGDGDEPTSNVALEGFINRLASNDDPKISRMLSHCVFKIVPMVAIDAVVTGSPYGGPYDVMARRWMDETLLPEIAHIKNALAQWFESHNIRLIGKLHGGQAYDNAPVWDFRIFDKELRKLLPKGKPENLDGDWNPFVRDAVPWVRKLTIFESYLQQDYDFWNFFSVHTNGRDPENLRTQGGLFAGLIARYMAG
jgi:hypothetical protein